MRPAALTPPQIAALRTLCVMPLVRVGGTTFYATHSVYLDDGIHRNSTIKVLLDKGLAQTTGPIEDPLGIISVTEAGLQAGAGFPAWTSTLDLTH